MDNSKDNTNCPDPKGILLIVGGAEDKGNSKREESDGSMAVLKCFVELTGVRSPIIEVVTTATGEDPQGSFADYQKAFTELGAGQVNHVYHGSREEAMLEGLDDRLKAAHGIFFAGGDQLKLTSVYGGTELMLLLKQRYINEPIVIGGTSAGAMALSTPMIYGGVGRDEMIAGHVKVTTGLEFLRDVCIDTHFVNRGRFVRMAQVIAENPACIGIGIEEDTGIIVRGGSTVEVVGGGVIIIIDGHKSYGTNITEHENEALLTIRGLKVDILSKGNTYELPQLNPPHK